MKVMWRRLGVRSIAAKVLTTKLDSFFCAMIAAITLKMLDPFGTGKLVLFQVTYDKVGFITSTNLTPILTTSSGLACLGTPAFRHSWDFWCMLHVSAVIFKVT